MVKMEISKSCWLSDSCTSCLLGVSSLDGELGSVAQALDLLSKTSLFGAVVALHNSTVFTCLRGSSADNL